MDLYLLRHGTAYEMGENNCFLDADRALNPTGVHEIQLVAQALKKLGLRFDHMLSSPLRRATETARIVSDRLGGQISCQQINALLPDRPPDLLARELNGYLSKTNHLLLVGHEPCLGSLATYLMTGKPRPVVVNLKKAGLAKLTADVPRPGSFSLDWLVEPALLGLTEHA